jgi:8-oxo-dGTP pyrophosphatase MutT (NUDIX family)
MSPAPFRSRGPAVAPEARRTKSRSAVRVLLLAPGSVLLFRDTDPGLPGSTWWMTPGGGIDAGESPQEAAVREVHEETGLTVRFDSVGAPFAHRVVVHGYSDQITVQDELFFAVELDAAFEVSTAGHTASERESVVGHRWWPLVELARSDAVMWPLALPDLIRLAKQGRPGIVELGTQEESTVPVDSPR